MLNNKISYFHHVNSPEQIGNGDDGSSEDDQQSEKIVEKLNKRLSIDRQNRNRPRDYASILREYNTPKYTLPTKSIYYFHNIPQKQRRATMTTIINQVNYRLPLSLQKVPPPSPIRSQKLHLTPRTNYFVGLYQASVHLNQRGKNTSLPANSARKIGDSDFSTNINNDNNVTPPLLTKQYASFNHRPKTNLNFSHYNSSISPTVSDHNLITSNNTNHKSKIFNRSLSVKSNKLGNNCNGHLSTIVPSIVQLDTSSDGQILIADGKRLLGNYSTYKKHFVVPS
ncbi:unnamed protein product [Didymodactylos carnosus]|uniref:Uncharacterized protein n=1 Tax=Didymodactylos carnosus TaxID=1234261 RepID=A0A813V1L9_9BILA|nr:unnamed protein product [Didymodactylos carnosus]CAF1228127.1 unnamed protein product [Didymodactylos carnosus]CAF3618535.1 unnamed protein product [Didymodactylos carnosus]CAF4036083.1 unnamed protein product [Didymodactylos carnosus]